MIGIEQKRVLSQYLFLVALADLFDRIDVAPRTLFLVADGPDDLDLADHLAAYGTYLAANAGALCYLIRKTPLFLSHYRPLKGRVDFFAVPRKNTELI